jgi:hypothetical protein
MVLQVRRSSLLNDKLIAIERRLTSQELQLVRDVRTRWSSVKLMLDRFLLLKEVCVAHCFNVTLIINR